MDDRFRRVAVRAASEPDVDPRVSTARLSVFYPSDFKEGAVPDNKDGYDERDAREERDAARRERTFRDAQGDRIESCVQDLLDKVHALSLGVAGISGKQDVLERNVQVLNRIVHEGNGQSLVSRTGVVEHTLHSLVERADRHDAAEAEALRTAAKHRREMFMAIVTGAVGLVGGGIALVWNLIDKINHPH